MAAMYNLIGTNSHAMHEACRPGSRGQQGLSVQLQPASAWTLLLTGHSRYDLAIAGHPWPAAPSHLLLSTSF